MPRGSVELEPEVRRIAPGRRIILLTVFTKQRMRETAEVRRAEQAMRRCRTEMHVAEDDDG
jgi:hypothetical protein